MSDVPDEIDSGHGGTASHQYVMWASNDTNRCPLCTANATVAALTAENERLREALGLWTTFGDSNAGLSIKETPA